MEDFIKGLILLPPMLEIKTIGGYGEFGRNCTAIKVDDEVILIDMGIHLENYINLTEDDEKNITIQELIWAKAVPDIDLLEDWKDKVIAIVPTHAHLDHVGAIPYLANEFDAPVYSTPFTNAVIKSIIRDKGYEVYNPLKVVQLNEKVKISGDIEIEFINITHSTPDSSMVVIHTKYGSIVYANDFKLDKTPTLGEESNLKRLKEIKREMDPLSWTQLTLVTVVFTLFMIYPLFSVMYTAFFYGGEFSLIYFQILLSVLRVCKNKSSGSSREAISINLSKSSLGMIISRSSSHGINPLCLTAPSSVPASNQYWISCLLQIPSTTFIISSITS